MINTDDLNALKQFIAMVDTYNFNAVTLNKENESLAEKITLADTDEFKALLEIVSRTRWSWNTNDQ